MFVYWFVFPILYVAILAGIGLGVRRIGVPFRAALVIPMGYCAAIAITAICLPTGATAWTATPVLLILATAGWLFSFRELRASVQAGALRRHWHWIVAGIAAFFVFSASTIAVGKPSFSGYNQIVDISSHLNWAYWISENGRDPVKHLLSSSDFHIYGTLPIGYPSGAQGLLGALRRFFGLELFWVWQPYLAVSAMIVVLGAYSLIRLVTPRRGFAAVGAFGAGQAAILIGYAQMAGIKELTCVSTLLPAAAVMPLAFQSGVKWWRAAFPFTVGLIGVYTAFSLTVLPWVGILGLGAALVVWRTLGLREALLRGGFAIVVGIIACLPTIIPSFHSGSFGNIMKTDVGNLATVMSRWSFSGIWITHDHRFALQGTGLTVSIILSIVVFALGIGGLYVAWRRKATALIILSVASLVGLKLVLIDFGDWMDLKALCLAAPVSLIMAVVGLSFFADSGRKPLLAVAWAGVIGIAAVGLFTDVLRYGTNTIAPHDRLAELQHYDKIFAGTYKALDPDWDENAGVTMRHAHLTQAFNNPYPPTEAWAKNPAKPSGDAYQWDLDNIQPAWINGYDLIVMRRAPGQSRPPGQYQMVAIGRFFTVWQKTADAAASQHLPLSGVYSPDDQKTCQKFVDGLPPDTQVRLAPGAPAATAVFDPAKLSKGLQLSGTDSVLFNGNAGTAQGTVNVGGFTGSFDVFVTSFLGRKLTVTVNGKKLTYSRDSSAGIRSQYLGDVILPQGGQANVAVTSGGTTLAPTSSRHANKSAWVGSLQLVPRGLLFPSVILNTAKNITCPTSVDWVEAV